MQSPPIAEAAVAEISKAAVYPIQLGPEYLRDSLDAAATEAAKYPDADLCLSAPAVAATEPPLDSASAGSAVAACQPAQASVPRPCAGCPLPTPPSGSGQPSVTTDLPAPPSACASGQTCSPQSRKSPIDGHAAKNQNLEVGNFNLFFGNWGTRQMSHNMRGLAGRVHSNINRQISKCPCIFVTLAEATADCASDLFHGYYNDGGIEPNDLDMRPSYEHFVHRSLGEYAGVLIACRKDNTTGLTLLFDEVHLDNHYRERRR